MIETSNTLPQCQIWNKKNESTSTLLYRICNFAYDCKNELLLQLPSPGCKKRAAIGRG